MSHKKKKFSTATGKLIKSKLLKNVFLAYINTN